MRIIISGLDLDQIHLVTIEMHALSEGCQIILQITAAEVSAKPYPYVVKQDIFEPTFFSALAADFPGRAIFEDQVANNGLVGSRTGSGFDIYRGDASPDALTGRSSA